MLIRDKNGQERIAMAGDFQDTSITLTPQEYQDLVSFFSFKQRVAPSALAKSTKSIMEKLQANHPKLKDGLEILDEQIHHNNS